MNVHVLTKLDPIDVPDNREEIRVFSTVKNEMLRLPYFLQYYRDRGVSRFFFIDNNSSDGSKDYLLEQKDCHVFFTTDSFRQSRAGSLAWENALLDQYGVGQWCLALDVDELLIYPECEKYNLKEFCAYLDAEGSEGLFTFLLDMYSDLSMDKVVYASGRPFLDICPYFDRDYEFVKRINLKGKQQFPPLEVIGGPRQRCFYPDQSNTAFLYRVYLHLKRRVFYSLVKLGLPITNKSIKSPDLFKVPLVKWAKGNAYISAAHEMRPVKLSANTGVLAHFKFFSDFHARVSKAISEGQYAGGSVEYKRYLEGLNSLSDGSFMYEGSIRYKGSRDLISRGLMIVSKEFKDKFDD